MTCTIPRSIRYLVLNTAMSKTWGFPAPCPANCACDCFDCRVDRCKCATPSRMCSMFPAEFLVDYVRVYQNKE